MKTGAVFMVSLKMQIIMVIANVICVVTIRMLTTVYNSYGVPICLLF